jgi:hypothetical protein
MEGGGTGDTKHTAAGHIAAATSPTIINLHTTYLFIKLTYTHLGKEGDTTHIDYLLIKHLLLGLMDPYGINTPPTRTPLQETLLQLPPHRERDNRY